MRAAIYARRSTEEQGASIERQERDALRLFEERGWSYVHTYADSASGWKANTPRPGFDRMMKEAGQRFDVLVVSEISRLSRQQNDNSALSIIWRLRGMGVEVESVAERSTGNFLADDLSLLIKSHAAKEESDTKSHRVTSGKRLGVLKGVHQGAWACYGYRDGQRRQSPTNPNRTIKFYEIDPVAAQVVNDIFVAYIDKGWSPQQIADWLIERGIAPPGVERSINHPYKRRAKDAWHDGGIRTLIANPLLAGLAVHKGQRLKDCPCASPGDPDAQAVWESCPHEWVSSLNVPPILSVERWEQAQEVLKGRRRLRGGRGVRSSSAVFLLSGLLWCDECAERIGTRTDRRGRHRYSCRGRRLGRCDLPHILRDEIDEAVRDSFVSNFVDQLDLHTTISRERERLLSIRNQEASIIASEIAQVDAEKRDAVTALNRISSDYQNARIKPEQFSRLEEELSARIEHANAALERLQKKLAKVEGGLSTEEIDLLLDQFDSIKRMISGRLTAEDVPRLNLQLREVFEEFRVSREGDRLIVDPKLRSELLPQGNWRTIDFADDDSWGVEVVEYLEPAFRKVDLTRDLASRKVTDNS